MDKQAKIGVLSRGLTFIDALTDTIKSMAIGVSAGIVVANAPFKSFWTGASELGAVFLGAFVFVYFSKILQRDMYEMAEYEVEQAD